MKAILEKIRNSRHRTLVYILCYTALFALCALVVFWYFIVNDKSFIWAGGGGNLDGISQHYTALSYWGSYLRSIFRTFISTGKISIPLYSTSIGLGGDVIQTLSYYVIGDPLTLLSAVVPRAYTEYLYNFLILLRMYLAGLSFSALALHLKKNNWFYTLIASMIYVFSAYALYASVRHPYFTNPMIYFPLIILGAEYIFKGKKPWLFILAIALAGVSNFYFFYMICFLTVIYAAVRVFSFAPKGKRKKIWSYLWRFALYAMLGVMMAFVLFYPSLRTTLASSRLESQSSPVPFLYTLTYYKDFLFTLPSAAGLGTWSFPGHLPLAFFALLLLWLTPKKDKTQITYYLICILMLLIPFFGWLLNGMSYVSNRWIWGYSLLIALICAFQLPKVAHLPKKSWLILGAGVVLFTCAGSFTEQISSYTRVAMIGLLITYIVLLLVYFFAENTARRRRLTRAALLVLVLLQLSDFATVRYDLGGYGTQFVDSGTAYENVLSSQGSALTNVNDTSFYRYEDYFNNDSSKQYNAALINGGNSTDGYFSLNSNYWYELLRSLGDTDTMVQKTQGLDNRTILGALTNVKYFTTDEDKSAGVLPYGYNRTPLFTAELTNHQLYRASAYRGDLELTNTYEYYKNEQALPLGYTYSQYITRSEYDALSYTDRQTALLYNAVLEDDTETALAKGSVAANSSTIDFSVKLPENEDGEKLVQQQGNTFVTYSSQKIVLDLKNAQPNKETYLILKGAEYIQNDPVTTAKNKGDWEDLLPREQAKLKENSEDYTMPNQVSPTITMFSTAKKLHLYTPSYTYYSGVHDFCINLGYYEEPPQKITIQLPKIGEYTFDIEVVQLDLSDYEAQTDALAAEHLENVVFSDNLITGNITVSEDKLMCLSLPYSPGWTAYVDGKEVPIKQTGVAFMGIELSAGEHTVELRYFTPYLAFGILVSAVGWAVFVIWVIIDLWKNKGKKKQKEGSK